MIAKGPLLRSSLRGALVGASALIGLCAAVPSASAQFGYYVSRGDLFDEPAPMPPRAVAYRLYDRGFTEVSRPRFDGAAYVVDATNPAGARVRLFVDAQSGAIIGRRPLDVPYYPSAREARPAPGYGWTEEDIVHRRTARGAEGLVPPADIPDAARGPAPARPSRQAALGADPSPRAASPDANPSGVNPDGKARPAAPSKKAARPNQPQKPAAVGAAAAQAPKADTSEAAKAGVAAPDQAIAPKQDVATAEAPKTEQSKPEQTKPEQPRTESSAPGVSQEESERAAAEAIKAAAGKQDQAWRDPTPDESKRKVRVIDGATVVPGSGESQAAATN